MPRTGWTLALMLAAAAGAAAQGYQPGKVGDPSRGTPTRVTKIGGDRSNPNVFQQMNQQIGNLQGTVQNLKGEVAAAQAAAAAGAAGAPAAPTGPTFGSGRIVVYGDVPPVPTWKERVQESKQKLPVEDMDELTRILARDNAVDAFAALALEKDGRVRYPTATLIDTLNGTRHRIVARGAALLLSRRRDPEVDEALAEHIGRRRPADDMAVEILIQRGSKAGREQLKERASHATSSDRAGLLAIRALAFHQGPDVTLLLNRLRDDWSSDVQEAATGALTLRSRAGLSTRTAYKPPPVGAPPEAVARVEQPPPDDE